MSGAFRSIELYRATSTASVAIVSIRTDEEDLALKLNQVRVAVVEICRVGGPALLIDRDIGVVDLCFECIAVQWDAATSTLGNTSQSANQSNTEQDACTDDRATCAHLVCYSAKPS